MLLSKTTLDPFNIYTLYTLLKKETTTTHGFERDL